MNRRNFLKGVGGLTLGLPFLGSLMSRAARAAATPANARFIVFFTCNGVAKQVFWPTKTSGTLQASDLIGRTLEPLGSLASKVTIPRGICTVPMAYGNCDHARGMTSQLTARERSGTYPEGDSLDHVLAQAVNKSLVPPLLLGVQANGSGGTGYISFRNGSPVAPENNPKAAFEDVINLVEPTAGEPPNPARDLLYERRKSILDLVARREFLDLTQKRLSRADRQKLEMHFELVRSIENRMEDTGITNPASVASNMCGIDPVREAEINAVTSSFLNANNNYPVIGKLQMDVMAFAIACGTTRVGVLQWNRGSGGPVFSFDGMNHAYRHHPLSHRSTSDGGSDGNYSQAETQLRQIDKWYATQFAYLANRLEEYTDGERSVLDDTAIVWGNELSDGLGHSHTDMPYVIAGSLAGYLKTGHVVTLGSGTSAPHNKLWTTIMNGMGVPTDGFGASCNGCSSQAKSGEFSELRAA